MTIGYLASWRGQEYEADFTISDDKLSVRLYRPDASEGFAEVSGERFLQIVPLSEVDEIHYVSEKCRWQEEEFFVIDRDTGGKVLLEYAGGEAPRIQQLDVEQVERGVYRAWVDESDVVDLCVVRERLYVIDAK